MLAIKPFNNCATDGHLSVEAYMPMRGLVQVWWSEEGTGRVRRGTGRVGERICAVQDIICVAKVPRTAATHGHAGGPKTVQQLRNRWPCCWPTFAQHMAIFPCGRTYPCVTMSRIGIRGGNWTGQGKERFGSGSGSRELCGSGNYYVKQRRPVVPQHMAMWVAIKPFNNCATDGHVVGHQTVQHLRNR